ncbi:hypothetical protein [Ekhidna sp.]|uniref:hypothetical protein n=1 Tax=Ekhidna sp. TaxID=2608089 RepID=UPI003BABD1F0
MIKSESTKSILREETIEIKNFQENNKDYLHFGFQNKFTDLDSVTATDVWSKYCDENPDKKNLFIFGIVKE